MPKVSQKIKLIQDLQKNALEELMLLYTVGSINGQRLSQKETTIIDDLILHTAIVEHLRYAVPFIRNSVPKSQHFFVKILPHLDENRFKELARLSWKNFHVVLQLIKSDDIFSGPRSAAQMPVAMQLVIVLYRLGSYGEGASISKIARLFGVGDGGTIQLFTYRIFKSLLNLKSRFIVWPSTSERQEIVASTFNELPHCIGYVDGTEIKIAEKPQQDPESFFSRKHVYSLKVQGVCDYKKRIRHLVLGYPGSVHDSRIFNNCDLSLNVHEYFSKAEWLAGDSAYKLTPTLITPYRENATSGSREDRKTFNKTFSKYRVRIEHCFGDLKERFGSLKELKIAINNDQSIKFACQWILVCSILHNIILENDNEDTVEPVLEEDNEDDVSNSSEVTGFITAAGELKRRALLEILRDT